VDLRDVGPVLLEAALREVVNPAALAASSDRTREIMDAFFAPRRESAAEDSFARQVIIIDC
jgi:hypothetical protein